MEPWFTDAEMKHALDNPIWFALTTEQSSQARGLADRALRYEAQVAPFVALPEDTASTRAAALEIVSPGEEVYFVGVGPGGLQGWTLLSHSFILQMHWQPMDLPNADAEIVRLGPADAASMLELTRLAFPGFFRARTVELGAYFGISLDGRLVSMAGERMRATGYQEISGVCTHPDYAGRGLAAILNAHVIRTITARGVHPFLHVSSPNTRAQQLYRKLGFVVERELPMWHVRRS